MLLPIVALVPLAYPSRMLEQYGRCGTQLAQGTVIMGSPAVATTGQVMVWKRGADPLTCGDSYTPGETLTAVMSGGARAVYDLGGGATFAMPCTGASCLIGCSSTRVKMNSIGEVGVLMPASGVVELWGGHAGGRSTVSITAKCTLSPVEVGSGGVVDPPLAVNGPPVSPPSPSPPPYVADNSWLYIRLTHALFMLVGWGIVLPLGVTIAAGFKQRIGAPRWYQLHRGLQISGLVLALIGVSIALVSFGTPLGSYGAHGILGLIVTSLGILQPLNGFLRPHKQPRGRSRIAWEWLHKGSGYTAIILSVVTITLGVIKFDEMSSVDMPGAALAIGVVYAVALVTILALLAYGCAGGMKEAKYNEEGHQLT